MDVADDFPEKGVNKCSEQQYALCVANNILPHGKLLHNFMKWSPPECGYVIAATGGSNTNTDETTLRITDSLDIDTICLVVTREKGFDIACFFVGGSADLK